MDKALTMLEMERYEDKFKKYAENKKLVEEEKQNAYEIEHNTLMLEIEQLAPRIKKLLGLKLLCDKYNVIYDNYSPNGDDKNYFIAESIHHRVGFIRNFERRCFREEIYDIHNSLAMKGGGFCGSTDIYVMLDNDDNVFVNGFNNRNGLQETPTNSKLKEFIKEFDNFETNFMNFIEETLSN